MKFLVITDRQYERLKEWRTLFAADLERYRTTKTQADGSISTHAQLMEAQTERILEKIDTALEEWETTHGIVASRSDSAI